MSSSGNKPFGSSLLTQPRTGQRASTQPFRLGQGSGTGAGTGVGSGLGSGSGNTHEPSRPAGKNNVKGGRRTRRHKKSKKSKKSQKSRKH